MWQRLGCDSRPAQEVSFECKSCLPQLHRCMAVFFSRQMDYLSIHFIDCMHILDQLLSVPI